MLPFIGHCFSKLKQKIWITLLISSFDLSNSTSRERVDKGLGEIILYEVY
jgi:hypothetical protein